LESRYSKAEELQMSTVCSQYDFCHSNRRFSWWQTIYSTRILKFH